MTIYTGGRNIYGFPVGVLTLQTQFPRIPGDIGNATTWPFPVLFKIVEGATPQRVVVEANPELIEPFCDGARELAQAGCRVITTSCGFLAVFQKEVAAAVPVPVACSSLIQVPMVSRLLAPGQKVGILTARKQNLTERHFNGVGWSSDTIPVVVEGMEDSPAWQASIGTNQASLDSAAVQAEISAKARGMVGRDPTIGAFVLECTNMPPYAAAIQRATGLAVFDIITLVNYLAASVQRTDYAGSM